MTYLATVDAGDASGFVLEMIAFADGTLVGINTNTAAVNHVTFHRHAPTRTYDNYYNIKELALGEELFIACSSYGVYIVSPENLERFLFSVSPEFSVTYLKSVAVTDFADRNSGLMAVGFDTNSSGKFVVYDIEFPR